LPCSRCEACESAGYLSGLDASLCRLFRVPTVAEVLGSLCVVGSTLVQLRKGKAMSTCERSWKMCDGKIGKRENAGREIPHPPIVSQGVARRLVHRAGVVGRPIHLVCIRRLFKRIDGLGKGLRRGRVRGDDVPEMRPKWPSVLVGFDGGWAPSSSSSQAATAVTVFTHLYVGRTKDGRCLGVAIGGLVPLWR
jgi:hypothetical protein